MASPKLLLIPLIIGIVLVILGCILGFVAFPVLLEDEVEKNVILEEDTLQWYRFKDIPFPISFKVYFFTINNPSEVIYKGAKPNVSEVGPYVWSESRTKNIKSIDADSVAYNELWSFKFNAKASGSLTEDDVLNVVNAPLIAIVQKLEDLPIALPVSIETLIGDIFEDTRLFIPVRVKDYAFDGLKMCDPTRSSTGYSKLICLSIMLMRVKLLRYNEDQSIMLSFFGYKKFEDGPFTMQRGIKDLDRLGQITSYKGQKYTDFWGTDDKGQKTECDRVEGHYTTYPPFMEKDTSWKVWSSDLCKGGDLNYVGETSFKDVDGYRFQTHKYSFAPAGEDCVCINETKGLQGTEHCFNDGLLDLHNCLGAPVILSFPHLMDVDAEFQETVDGLDSSYSDSHNSLLDFEPNLGFPLQGALRMQFNLVLRPMKYGNETITSTKSYPRALLPIIWLEDSFELTDALIDELNEKLLSKLVLMDAVTWTLIAVGILLAIVAIGFCIFYKTRKAK